MSKIIVGLSGGVDSSVSALLLKQQGMDIAGVFMKNWEEDDVGADCPAAEDIADAKSVADRLDIAFHSINFSREYWDRVFAYFLQEYQAGRTPNPDILCNKEIKFKAFLDYALSLGATHIATGHYARVREVNGSYQLLKGLDANKDQSYFLHQLGQAALSRAIFPVGDLPKSEVRKLADQAGFQNAKKKDSTGICFIGERKFKEFLQRYLPAQPGAIVDAQGKVIGRHEGLMYYTIGQRQGIGIGGLKGASDAPWYVAQKNLIDNTLVVVQDHNHPLLMAQELSASQMNWVAGQPPAKQFSCMAKTRYRQPDQACEVKVLDDDKVQVKFTEAQRAITPGQSLVLYQGEVCLGGGVIEG
jgi:tRNA-specific 2-thiouridylase